MRHTFTKIILVSCLTLSCTGLFAQNIKGKITDAQTGEPLPYATISLFSKPDSLLVDGASSEENGVFVLDLKPGRYFAKVEFLAYEPLYIDDLEPKKTLLDLGNIALRPETETLNEVVVQAEKSAIQFSLDKKIFNVGKDLANAGGSAAELLSNIPSVQVDVEGNVSLRGSGNVRILIDGKPSGLVSVNGASGLQQLQGSMVERVEIITNPGARYEAEGVGGIINIILKKEERRGFNGAFDLTAGLPHNYGLALNLNYRRERLNFFINYGVSYRTSPSDGSVYQRAFAGDTTFIYRQTNTRNNHMIAQNVRGGLDFYFNPKNVLTAAYTLRRTDGDRIMDIEYRDFLFDENNLVAISTRRQDEQETEPNSEYSLNYKRTFDKQGHEFIAEMRVLDYWEDSEQDYTEKFFLPDGSPSGVADRLQNSYNYETERQYLLQADYVHPFSKDGRIEGGLRSSFRDMDNDYRVTEFMNGEWATIPGLDNRFLYDENIHAIYGIYGDKKGKFSWLAGLRAEYTDVVTELAETGEKNARDYANLFPSAHFTYDLPNQNALQVSYSRRVRRPRYNDLSPFVTYSDERNYWSGNPDLDPEFTDAYELGHIKYFEKGSLSSSIYYRYTTGKIERIRRVDAEGNAATRPENLSTEHAFGLEFTSAYELAKWWKMDGNFNFFRAITDGGNLGPDFEADTYTWFARLTSRLTFWKNTDLQLRGNYEAKMQTPQGYRKPNYFLDVAISKDILKNNATITLNVSDLFNTRRHRHVTEGTTFYTESDGQWRRRQANLTFSYRLRQQKKRGGGMEEGGDF
jgi:outer membrane receptor protein involved in Fe transport